ncbi:thioredoxin family protein [soil metagenome]
MPNLNKNTENLSVIRASLSKTPWLVACLCAAWCDTCTAYRKQFHTLQEQHLDKCFAWIDIEDLAYLVEDVDIENFPTLLIQHNDQTLFFGTMLPDASQLHRLLISFEASLTEDTAFGSKNTSLCQEMPPEWSLRRIILENQ